MSVLHHETPILQSASMNARLGKQVYMKMEAFQPVGSFKIRGIGALCQKALNEGKTSFVSSSGGNAGLAAAYAGRVLGVKVTVVVPETTNQTAKARILAENAELIVHGRNWNEADSLAKSIVKESNAAYIHPFDNPAIWAGHATMIEESANQMPKPDVLVVSVGGGGLLAGIIEGLHKIGWQDVPVLAVETEGAASLAASINAGKLVSLDSITSLATTLGAKQVAEKSYDWTKTHPIKSVVVSDKAAVNACLAYVDEMRVLVEPACGASLSLLYENQGILAPYQSVLMIVCGGAGVSLDQLRTWQEAS